MLEIQNQEYFDEVVAFAKKIGMHDQLQEQLSYLATYADHNDEGLTKCLLGSDFAPQSFSFLMQKKDKDGQFQRWFNGGLIFHGDHDNGGDGGAPTFSVNLVPMNGWQIHT